MLQQVGTARAKAMWWDRAQWIGDAERLRGWSCEVRGEQGARKAEDWAGQASRGEQPGPVLRPEGSLGGASREIGSQGTSAFPPDLVSFMKEPGVEPTCQRRKLSL